MNRVDSIMMTLTDSTESEVGPEHGNDKNNPLPVISNPSSKINGVEVIVIIL